MSNEVVFEVDDLIKQEFLDHQTKATKEFYSSVLKKVDEYEKENGKKVYDFNIEDRDELLLTKFKNGTPWSFQSHLSPIKKYVDFCISPKNLATTNENRFATILRGDFDKYINNQAMENYYIPREENRELQQEIVNPQDRLIPELLSWGIRGRTQKGNTHEELINLKVADVDWELKGLNIYNNDGEHSFIEVDGYALDLIKEAVIQRNYICGNGLKKKNDDGIREATNRFLPINETEFVFRQPGKNLFGKVDQQHFSRRMQLMRVWLNKPYITISSIYMSALIDYAKELIAEKGELTMRDYVDINEKFRYGKEAEKYWYKTKEIIDNFIKRK